MSQPPSKPTPAPPKMNRLKSIKPNIPGDAVVGSSGSTTSGVTRPTTTTTTTSTTTPSISNITPNISKVKKEFKPNIVNRKKPSDKGGVDPLSTGAISDLLGSSLSPISSIGDKPSKPSHSNTGKFRPTAFNPNRKKPAATANIQNLFSTPLIQAETQQQQSSYEMNKKNEKKDSDLLAQLFHEMEVDPMQPFHPTHLPLVDPRKIMKTYSLDDASKDIDEKKRELELKIANGELSDTTNFTLQPDNLLDSNANGGTAAAAKKNREQSTRDRPFYVEDQFLNKDKLFFIQLPNSLPTTVSKPNFNIPPPVLPQPKLPAQPKPTTTTTTDKDGNPTTDKPEVVEEQQPPKIELDEKSFVPMIYPGDFPPSLKEIESGKLGTLKIYKSGKTILKIGSVEYDISSGDKLKFLEEVMCFQTKGGPENQPTCYTLGIPSQHLVAAPIISQISGI